LEATLNGEIDTLGYPKAALFAFCVALVSYNVMSTVKAALRAAHGAEAITEEVSGYYTDSGNFVRSCSTDCVDCAR
jgi:hypothetical protein